MLCCLRVYHDRRIVSVAQCVMCTVVCVMGVWCSFCLECTVVCVCVCVSSECGAVFAYGAGVISL